MSSRYFSASVFGRSRVSSTFGFLFFRLKDCRESFSQSVVVASSSRRAVFLARPHSLDDAILLVDHCLTIACWQNDAHESSPQAARAGESNSSDRVIGISLLASIPNFTRWPLISRTVTVTSLSPITICCFRPRVRQSMFLFLE